MSSKRCPAALPRAACVLAFLGAIACASALPKVEVIIGGQTFRVEVARTDEQRQKGLMHRRSLGEREGMLFVFPADDYLSFWMKNTLVPLSIAFLNAEGRIVQIEDMQPLSLQTHRARRLARYALEVPQGTFRRLGVAEGELLQFPGGLPQP